MLRDPVAAERLEREGYVVVPLVGRPEVAALRAAWEEILAAHEPEWDPTGMATTVRHPASDRLADAAIRSVLDDPLAVHFDAEEPFFSAFITKRPGAGELPPHLDWSLVDESQHRTYGCWLALEDVEEANGVLGVVPGSHLLVDFERTPDEPGHDWVRAFIADGAQRVDVPVSAGEAVVFDHRLVHFSAPNRTDRRRGALNIAVAPSSRAAAARAQLLEYMRQSAAAQLSPDEEGEDESEDEGAPLAAPGAGDAEGTGPAPRPSAAPEADPGSEPAPDRFADVPAPPAAAAPARRRLRWWSGRARRP